MSELKISIHPDIRQANTLPGWFYNDPAAFEQAKETIFARSWQLIPGAETDARLPGDVLPFSFLDHFLDEPLLLLRNDNNALQCLSNVCTHRGKILVEHPGRLDKGGIICGYHGRRFGPDGQMISMPEMQQALHFPCAADHLTNIPLAHWKQFSFASLQPAIPSADWLDGLEQKVGFMPVESFRFAPERSRDYLVKAHWALYCDNYLEGFHIPFVHKSLAAALDWGKYETVLYPYGNCQVGVAKGGEQIFDFPTNHEDYGKSIAAYYFWFFPNLMLNFYPWGLSVNWVKPLSPQLTKVSFRSYIWDESKLNAGAGADLDLVEREDEAVVEQVAIGTRSRYYSAGRFSPAQEKGVHQFHRLVAAFYDSSFETPSL